MAAAESLIFGGARSPATAPKESKALTELKELKDPTMLEEPKVLEKPKERKELKEPNVLKDPRASGATSIVLCNYFVLGVKAYGATSTVVCNYFVWSVKAYRATSIVVCKPTRPTSCGRRCSPSLGQTQEWDLLGATARSFGNEPDATRGNKLRLDMKLSFADGRSVRYHPKAIFI